MPTQTNPAAVNVQRLIERAIRRLIENAGVRAATGAQPSPSPRPQGAS
jgi:hypothetical protein